MTQSLSKNSLVQEVAELLTRAEAANPDFLYEVNQELIERGYTLYASAIKISVVKQEPKP